MKIAWGRRFCLSLTFTPDSRTERRRYNARPITEQDGGRGGSELP